MTTRNLLMSAGLAALLAGTGTAQTTGDTGTATDDAPAIGTTEGDPGAAAPAIEFTSLEEMTVGDVVGLDVVSPDGETIGDIDSVIGTQTGASAVIGIGGFLGIGKHTVALPLSDFGYDAEQRVLTLGTDRETLEAQAAFDDSGMESLPEETPLATLMESEDAAGTAEAGDDAGMTDQSGAADEAAQDGVTDEGAATEGAADDAAGEDAMGDDAAATDDDVLTDDAATGDASVTDDAATDDGSLTEDAASGDASATEDDTAGGAGSTEESAVDGDTGEDGASEEEVTEGSDD